MKLGVDMNSGEWARVVEYVNARIEELTGICTSSMATHEQREQAAFRIAELRELVNAPRRTRELAGSAEPARSIY